MLKPAFNALTRMHSQPMTLKRLGTPNLYSPIRAMPSNYFRYLEGPSQTVIHGREFVLPDDAMTGTQGQKILFDEVPTSGSWTVTYDGNTTTSLDFDADAAAVQVALRLLTGLENVTVTGDYTSGFLVKMFGVEAPEMMTVAESLDTSASVAISNSTRFSPVIQRGDKIIHPTYGHLAIDEIIEIVDLGGAVMGYRVRVE